MWTAYRALHDRLVARCPTASPTGLRLELAPLVVVLPREHQTLLEPGLERLAIYDRLRVAEARFRRALE